MVTAVSTEIAGVVRAANTRGVKLEGEAEWRNVSKWATVEPPNVGERVVLRLDGAGYVRAITPSGETSASPDAEVAHAEPSKDAQIRRMAVLNTAVALLSSHQCPLSVGDVLGVAGELEQWVLR